MPLWVTLFLLHFCMASPPEIIQATQYRLSTAVQGDERDFAILEMELDQDVYYTENWAPACISSNLTATCPPSRTRSTSINETGFMVIDLSSSPDLWVNYNVPFGQATYFKFFLDPSQFPSSCPIVQIFMEGIIGQGLVSISNQGIPTTTSYQYQKIPWSTLPSMWISPAEDEWRWGWWYFSVFNRPPVVENAQFRVKWSTVANPICGPPKVEPIKPTVNDTWILLSESIPSYGVAGSTFQFARFYIQTQCSNFSIQIRSKNVSLFGDLDFYVSRSEPNPTIYGSYEWAAHCDGFDSLTLWNICSLDNSTLWPIYVGFYNWASESTEFTIVATTVNMGFTRPLVDLSPLQLSVLAAAGGARLTCPQQEFFCFFPSFTACTDPYSRFFCCTPFSLESPFEEVYPLIVPKSGINADIYLFDLPWGDTKRNSTSNLPRKLVYSLLLSIDAYNGDLISFFNYDDISSCVLSWRNIWTNQAGQPLEGSVSFTPKQFTCDETAIIDIGNQVLLLRTKMEETLDYGLLRVYQYQISELMAQSAVIGCQQLVDEFLSQQTLIDSHPNQTNCYEPPFSPQYDASPCCSAYQSFYECCGFQTVGRVLSSPESTLYPLISQSTKTPECSDRALGQYVLLTNDYQSEVNGCRSRWTENASPETFAGLISFVAECREQLQGSSSLLGVPCLSDSDCFYNRTCNLTTLRCNHDEDTVLDCFVERMSPTVSAALFDLWRIPAKSTPELLKAEMINRFFLPTCRGPKSIEYRSHWWYLPEIDSCVDACISDPPRCFEQASCHLETFPCNLRGVSSEFCWRVWLKVQATQNSLNDCIVEQTCNWMDCPVGSTQAQCQSQCLNVSNVCLDCTGSRCVALPRNQSTCVYGCTTDNQITDPAQCVLTGTCSVPCNGCSASTCQSLGSCQGIDAFYNLVSQNGNGGACFAPVIVDIEDGHTSCVNSTMTKWGCAFNMTSAQCSSNGYQWIANFTTTNLTTCESVLSGCWNSFLGLFVDRNASSCSCASVDYLSWSPYFTWIPATYSPGVVYNLQWVNTSMQSVRFVHSSIDYPLTNDIMQQAVVSITSLFYSSDAICRYSPTLDVSQRVSCDTINSTLDNCFSETDSTLLVKLRGCPFLPSNTLFKSFSLDIYETTFPATDFCQQISVSESQIAQFSQKADHSVTSEVFRERPPNKWAVVTNHQETGIVVGQIKTNMIIIDFNNSVILSDNMTLCIPIRNESYPDASEFTTYALAKLDSQQVIRPYVYAVYQNGSICGNISSGGSYIGAIVVCCVHFNDYRADYDSVSAQAIVAAVIYGLLLLESVYLFSLNLWLHTKGWELKALFSSFVIIFCLCRTLFFAIPQGLITSASYHEALFEFPSFLFLIIYTCVLYYWTELAFKTRRVTGNKKNNIRSYLFPMWAFFAFMIFMAYIAFLIASKTLPEVVLLPCDSKVVIPASPQLLQVQQAYLSFLAAMSILLAILFLVAGMAFLIPQRSFLCHQEGQTSDLTRFTRMTLAVMLTFTTFFIVKSVLFWAHSFTVDNGLIVPVMVFCVLEAVPIAVFLWYLHPRNKSTRSSSSTKSRPETDSTGGSSSVNDPPVLRMKSKPLPKSLKSSSKNSETGMIDSSSLATSETRNPVCAVSAPPTLEPLTESQTGTGPKKIRLADIS